MLSWTSVYIHTEPVSTGKCYPEPVSTVILNLCLHIIKGRNWCICWNSNSDFNQKFTNSFSFLVLLIISIHKIMKFKILLLNENVKWFKSFKDLFSFNFFSMSDPFLVHFWSLSLPFFCPVLFLFLVNFNFDQFLFILAHFRSI